MALTAYGVRYLALASPIDREPARATDWLTAGPRFAGCLPVTPAFRLDNQVTPGIAVGALSAAVYAALPLPSRRGRAWGRFAFGPSPLAPPLPWSNRSLDGQDAQAPIVLGALSAAIARSLRIKVRAELPSLVTRLRYCGYVPSAMPQSAALVGEPM